MNLTYNGIESILDRRNFGAELKLFSFPHGIYELREINYPLKSFPSENMKVEFITTDIIMKTDIFIETKKNDMLKFDEKGFFSYSISVCKN